MAPIIRTCSLIALSLALLPQAAWAKREAKGEGNALRNYVLGRMALFEGNEEEALARFSRVVRLHPGDAQVASRAMREAVRQGDMKLAVQAALQMGQPAQLAPDALLLLITDRLKQGDARGVSSLSEVLEINENFKFLPPLLRSWMAVQTKGGDPIKQLDAISRRSTAAFYVPEIKAMQLFAVGRVPEGLTLARSLALTSNSTPALRLNAATYLMKAARRDEAIGLLGAAGDELEGALKLAEAGGKDMPPAIRTAPQGVAQLYSRLAGDLITQKAPGFALMFARYARYLDPVNPFVALVEARAMSEAGLDAQANLALQQLAGNPVVSKAANEARVGVLLSVPNDAEAMTLAQQLVDQSPKSVSALIRLAEAQARSDKFAEAAANYGKAADLAERAGGGEPWLLYYSQGSALERGGQWKEARAALEKAVSLAPNQPGPLNHLGYALLERREELPKALDLIKRALDLNPSSNEILDSYGWALYLNGDFDGAIDALERAVQRDPLEATLGEHLGDVLWAAGRKVDARYAWRAAFNVAEGDVQKRLTAKMDDGLASPTPAIAGSK